MTELEQFMKSVEGKSLTTIRNYKSQYVKLFNMVNKPIANTSENKLINIINETENVNAKQALINIGIQVRRLNHLSVKKLENERENNKHALIGKVKNTNLKLQQSLPSYDELINYLEALYQSSNWTDYIINYLLINYHVRNQDLDFKIVKLKRDTKDLNFNYIWLAPSKIVYIRNIYKTSGSYGQKNITITDKKFTVAVKRVYACQKHGDDGCVFIPNQDQLGYYIKKATYKQIGEGNVLKIIINHFIKDIPKLTEISVNRGTNIDVLLSNYNITNV
jgi:hypothetical protein